MNLLGCDHTLLKRKAAFPRSAFRMPNTAFLVSPLLPPTSYVISGEYWSAHVGVSQDLSPWTFSLVYLYISLSDFI